MLHKLICIITFSLPILLWGQQKVESHYYSEYQEITDSSSAKFIATYSYNDTIKKQGTIIIKNLWGKLISESEYSNIERKILNGYSKTYYENGKLKSQVSYNDGVIDGEVTTYFPAGQLKRKDFFILGNFKEGKCYSLAGQEITHFDFKTIAQFPGGTQGLYTFIYANTQYPEEAKINNIQGTVIVKLTIDKKGKIINQEIFKSVHPLLDAEALQVAKILPNFIPGQEDGEFSNSLYFLPIKFETSIVR